MSRAGLDLRIIRCLIRLACLCLPLLNVPLPVEAVTVATPCKAEPTDEVISYGDVITCVISPAGDTDTFRFAGLPNEKVIVQAFSTMALFAPCVELYGPDGVLVSSFCSSGSSKARIDVTLEKAGTHTILVGANNGIATGSYNLVLERTFPLTPFGAPIKYGQTLVGQTIDLIGVPEVFVLNGAKDSTVIIQATSTTALFALCLELHGPDGVLVSGFCSSGSATARINVTLTQDGTHTLLVASNGNTTGTFNLTLQCIFGACTDAIPTSLAAAVSPPSLSVPVGTPATAVATITNTGSAAAAAEGDSPADPSGPNALGCSIAPLTGMPLPFFYQALEPVTQQPIGSPNTPVNLLPGANQSFLVSLTPTTALCPTQVTFGFSCSNAGFADTITGVNTLLLTAGPQASCGLRTSASASQPTFAVGQTLIAGGSVTNPGLTGTAADFYVGILRPDGSIQFFTSTGIVVGNVADLRSFQPLAVNVPLATPFSTSQPSVFTHQWTAGDLRGPYLFFLAAVKTGALAGGTIANDQILSVATAPYAFP
jgi:hypothetical protein